ncbi:MAG: hypothetical protein JNK09_03495 [Prolixibacteraceae bacterium]|nr:hypothetical protein [Prolixibacteraceae bacterium]
MEEFVFFDEDGDGFTRILKGSNIELINPIDYYKTLITNLYKSSAKDILYSKNPQIASNLDDFFYYELANEQCEKIFAKINSVTIPENFIKLLNSQKKKEQINLLKNQSITSDQFLAFIFSAWTNFDYKYSIYSFEHHHKGLDESKLPIFYSTENNKVIKVGQTSLSDGELKQAIENRKVAVAKFFDKGDNWHCFYLTYDSIKGKESWKDGQPHYHYLSSEFGLVRKEIIRRFETGDYPSSPIHIDLLNYRNSNNSSPKNE